MTNRSPNVRPAAEVLPIDALREDFLHWTPTQPVVVSSPTGSGKSTQIPRWCPGRVLVVEPRRVACRALAQRVAELEGVPLGSTVGYRVRDERRESDATRILFVTPGMALRMADVWDTYDHWILDEFHERSLDTDLLLALLTRRRRQGLVVMSATLEGDRIAQHLGGRHLQGEGRQFPVEVEHLAGQALLPEVRGLEGRVRAALDASREHPGDVLVFLPGKGEIQACSRTLSHLGDVQLLELHGGLSLEQQAKVFQPTTARKVVLTTNVAETSLTVPGIGVVIDSGLVRRTRYHRDRGFLTLGPIALDSADQRAGRAGRTAAGVAYRLWGDAAQLEKTTPPEIFRESLVPLLLAAGACDAPLRDLPFLDPPPTHAVDTAGETLRDLGALTDAGTITPRGHRLFGLPLDPFLGRLLVEAETQVGGGADPAVLDDVLDLVSTLGVDRPLVVGGFGDSELGELGAADGPELDVACDALLSIRALRDPGGWGRRAHRHALGEAQALRRRLLRIFDRRPATDLAIDRRRLALLVLAADRRVAHVARRRKRRVAWSNGGTEIELGRDSAAGRLESLEALAVLATRALGLGGRDTRIVATRVMPLPLAWLRDSGLGRDRLADPSVEGTPGDDARVVARVERVYAGRVLETREEVPSGDLARRSVVELVLGGRLFGEGLELCRDRLEAARLAEALARREHAAWHERLAEIYELPIPDLETWLDGRLMVLGFERGEDLALLSADDLVAPELPADVVSELDRTFPRQLTVPGASYSIRYDLARRDAFLDQQTGRKRRIPSPHELPRLRGFRVVLRHKGTSQVVRERTG